MSQLNSCSASCSFEMYTKPQKSELSNWVRPRGPAFLTYKSKGIDALYLKGTWLGLVEQTEYWDYMMDPYSCYKLIKDGAKAAPNADCVFVTCMVSPILGIVDTLEKEIGKPIISSSSATLYGTLKKLGIQDPVPHYGEALVRPRKQCK